MVGVTVVPAYGQPLKDSRENGASRTNVKTVNGKKPVRSYERSKDILQLERQHSAGNYHPIGVVFDRALGAKVWDADGGEYIDCLSAYSAVNQYVLKKWNEEYKNAEICSVFLEVIVMLV